DLSDKIVGSVKGGNEGASSRPSASALADIGSFAAFVIIVVWFGWWFVRQFKGTMDTAVASFTPRTPAFAMPLGQPIPETRIEVLLDLSEC
ncbi:hypothetical protein LPJ81_007046, partial [Coemansia sp. IMI 209127]